jgi:membrane-associated phospholipid phosphatase
MASTAPPTESADLRLLRVMRTRGHTPALESAAKALGKAGNNALVWVVLGSALALIDPSRRESWLICAALGPIAIGLNYLVKLVVKRPRPVLEGLPPLGGAPSSLSFPSAHAFSSFAVATAMFRVDPATAGAFVVAILLSLGRPYLGMHYPFDVLVGAILGMVLGLLVPLAL